MYNYFPLKLNKNMQTHILFNVIMSHLIHHIIKIHNSWYKEWQKIVRNFKFFECEITNYFCSFLVIKQKSAKPYLIQCNNLIHHVIKIHNSSYKEWTIFGHSLYHELCPIKGWNKFGYTWMYSWISLTKQFLFFTF